MIGELNDIGVSVFIVLLGLDVWFTYKIYHNEYNDTKENKEDIVIKRGSEWDYEYKDTKKNKNK